VGRKIDADDLVGIAEIAQRLLVSPHTIKSRRTRDPSFPAPVAELERGGVWAWSDVEAWAVAQGWPSRWPQRRLRR
jgi:hypothetical protein